MTICTSQLNLSRKFNRLLFSTSVLPLPMSSTPATVDATTHQAKRRIQQLASQLTAATAMSLESNSTAAAVSSPTLNIAVSTHVLNTATGQPAQDVRVTFESLKPGSTDQWIQLAEARTNADGRVSSFPPIQTQAPTADYRLRFASGEYFIAQGVTQTPFFPQVTIQWQVCQKVDQTRTKLHIPLLLSPFGYSSYRGS